MIFTISAFTHRGTSRDTNQDCILVNGSVLSEGKIHLEQETTCHCFVADGVGGNREGGFASRFVLEKLNDLLKEDLYGLEERLYRVNVELLETSGSDVSLKGTATTLSGLIMSKKMFHVVHAGDSQIWLLRGDVLFQTTIDQVLDDSVENSPITSYFGGFEDRLRFDDSTTSIEPLPGDIFLICSDGLFKSLKPRIVKSILKADREMSVKSDVLLENCLQKGAEDNTSAIIIKYSDQNG